ncbi:antirestriction protein [Serratia ficaria]|uniref:antirestriction protein n=1 Tax=Serratia ficaria TaxID=61651 RepID=UPI00077C41AA|nr:antirestriction protein [Serratia ficaria]
MTTEPTEIVTATVIPHNRRTAFLPRLFGAWHLAAQGHIFRTAENLSKDYTGGSWEFKELSNGGGYLVPKCAEEFHVSVSGNYFSGTLSADAAGIVFTLFTLNALIWHAYHNEYSLIQNMLITQQERLKQFARDHKESGRIFAAID